MVFIVLTSSLLTDVFYKEYGLVSALSVMTIPLLFALSVFILLYILKGMLFKAVVMFIVITVGLVNATAFDTMDKSEESNITVATVNLLWDNENHYVKIKENLKKLDPDVVFIQEYNEEQDINNLLEDFPFIVRGSDDEEVLANVLIASKLLLEPEGTIQFYDKVVPHASIMLNGEKVHMVSIHTLSPTSNERAKGWIYDLNKIKEFASKFEGKLIMAGDFNANAGMQPFRSMINSTELQPSSYFNFTWGSKTQLKFTHLDHIVTIGGIKLNTSSVYGAPSSDHSIVYAELDI